MRRSGFIAVAVLVALVGFLAWWTRPGSADDAATHASASAAPAVAGGAGAAIKTPPAEVAPPTGGRAIQKRDGMTAKVLPGGEIIVPEFAEVARRLHSSATTGSEDLAMIESFIDFYMRANGGAVPQGSENEEIVAVLRGQNAHRLAVIPPDVRGIDDRGRLLDRWGTAYFFHPVSRTVLDVRSAGPDRRWWTDDDLIGRRAAAEATAGL